VASLKSTIKTHEKEMAVLRIEAQKRNDVVKEYVASLESMLKAREEEMADLSSKTRRRDAVLDKAIVTRDEAIVTKDETIAAKDRNILKLNVELEKRENAARAREPYIHNLKKEIEDLKSEIERREGYSSSLTASIGYKQKEIEDIHNSTVFRYMVRPLWTFLLNIRKAKKSLGMTIRNTVHLPRRFLSKARGLPEAEEIGICTIISKNYLAYARLLTESFLQYNKGRVFVLLTDSVDGYFEPEKEQFTLIKIDELKERIPDFERFCFQYNFTELNTAVKPFFLELLFERYNLKKLIFLDPDILITSNLNELFGLLSKHSIVLIPHITQPFKDLKKPNELDILRSGVYNLGFIGLSNKGSTPRLLSWWKEKLQRYCKIDYEKRLFVDQRWIDIIPGFFEDVFILRDESYNIAYWNLHYRSVSMNGEDILVNGAPVHFLHFSGFDPSDMDEISRHQDRFMLPHLEGLKPVFELYKERLMSCGYKSSRGWPSVFGYFDNGAKISDLLKDIYWHTDEDTKQQLGDPFCASKRRSFVNWLNEPQDPQQPVITRLMSEIYDRRIDLKKHYPDIFGKDRGDFLEWFSINSKTQYDLDDLFILTGSATRGIIEQKDHPGKGRVLSARQKGVNLLGYLSTENGIGEAARACIRSLASAKIDYSLISNATHPYARQQDGSFTHFSKDNPHYVNVMYVNADMLPRLHSEVSKYYFKDKYNIGCWSWELSDFPEEWIDRFIFVDEIWTPSNFSLESIAKKTNLPIIRMPHGIAVDGIKNVDKAYFGLKKEEFVFLFIFDFLSYFARKNPLAVIDAFKKAFSPAENARLVIKCCSSEWDSPSMKIMKEACKGHNITIIKSYLNRDEVNALVSLCDSFVSLHRSEGFGLAIAEAMFLGKPVIATGFSGNTDFMNINNSYPVKYELVKIGKDIGPYKKGYFWAEPDVAHASELMRYVYENREESKELGRIAALDIRKDLSHEMVGNRIKNRIEEIYKRRKPLDKITKLQSSTK